MEINNNIQKKILLDLTHNPGLNYNCLWNKIGESNKFNYHLQQLIKLNLVFKQNELYYLTSKGKTYISQMDGQTAEIKKKPVICVFIMALDLKSNEILIQIRKKEPFFEFAGIPGGKIEFGQSPLDAAKEEFLEETGLSGKLKLSAVSNFVTKSDNSLMHHVIAFTYICLNTLGNLIEENREGKNKWIKISDLDSIKRFPDLDLKIKKILSDLDSVHYFNIERIFRNNSFESLNLINDF